MTILLKICFENLCPEKGRCKEEILKNITFG